MPKKPINTYEDDMVLWQRVVNKVTPLKSKMQSVEPPSYFTDNGEQNKTLLQHSNQRHKKKSDVSKTGYGQSINGTALFSNKISPVDLRHGERAGIDGRTQKRLFRGEVLVDRRIDLHGLTAAKAEYQLKRFVEGAVYEGCRCVLVITGKGAGVLRENVPSWLKQLPLSPYILALAEARPKDGGGGALYVLLRRKRKG